MIRLSAFTSGALLSLSLAAQSVPQPEVCLARSNADAVATATHNGSTYSFTSDVCRDQFLTDPDRYAQLYDAIRELEAESGKRVAPKQPSLVPS